MVLGLIGLFDKRTVFHSHHPVIYLIKGELQALCYRRFLHFTLQYQRYNNIPNIIPAITSFQDVVSIFAIKI